MRAAASTLTARATYAATTITSRRASPARAATRRCAMTTRADGKAAELAPLEQRVDLRVGLVLSAKRHEEAEKLVRERLARGSVSTTRDATRREDGWMDGWTDGDALSVCVTFVAHAVHRGDRSR